MRAHRENITIEPAVRSPAQRFDSLYGTRVQQEQRRISARGEKGFIRDTVERRTPLGAWAAMIGRATTHLLLVGLVFLVMGELWFRMPWTTKILVYEFDAERYYRIAAGQSRGLGLGNFSVISPPIGINSDGFRNPEIDWNAPAVLVVGSSDVLGQGVEDEDVWTAILGRQLLAAGGWPITVVNAGTPGYGPYHQAVTVRRYLERHPRPRLVVVRAAVTDGAFPKPSQRDLDDGRRHFALSSRVRRVSEFLPFLVNRLGAQLRAIRERFSPNRPAANLTIAREAPAVADATWRSEGRFWKEIVDLAAEAGVPVLFFVDGGDGAASAVRLRDLLVAELATRSDVGVSLFGAHETGLDVIGDDEVRRQHYRERFTLGYDPHANARQHRLIAEFLAPIVAARGPWISPPVVAASDRRSARR